MCRNVRLSVSSSFNFDRSAPGCGGGGGGGSSDISPGRRDGRSRHNVNRGWPLPLHRAPFVGPGHPGEMKERSLSRWTDRRRSNTEE